MTNTWTPPPVEAPEPCTFHNQPATRVRQGNTVAIYMDGCAYCADMLERGWLHFPDHFNGGHRPHCTCDRCW